LFKSAHRPDGAGRPSGATAALRQAIAGNTGDRPAIPLLGLVDEARAPLKNGARAAMPTFVTPCDDGRRAVKLARRHPRDLAGERSRIPESLKK